MWKVEEWRWYANRATRLFLLWPWIDLLQFFFSPGNVIVIWWFEEREARCTCDRCQQSYFTWIYEKANKVSRPNPLTVPWKPWGFENFNKSTHCSCNCFGFRVYGDPTMSTSILSTKF
jgi:hypothetical protein